MPFINVKTNTEISDSKKESIKTRLGKAITAIPGKSESWLMVGIQPECDLWFRGDPSPAAMIEVSVYGSASSGALSKLTAQLTDIMGDELAIPADRIYVKYASTDDWGWNGSNF